MAAASGARGRCTRHAVAPPPCAGRLRCCATTGSAADGAADGGAADGAVQPHTKCKCRSVAAAAAGAGAGAAASAVSSPASRGAGWRGSTHAVPVWSRLGWAVLGGSGVAAVWPSGSPSWSLSTIVTQGTLRVAWKSQPGDAKAEACRRFVFYNNESELYEHGFDWYSYWSSVKKYTLAIG
eukprot:COSAG01_NODE_11815_length_1853_cov_20.888255_1_plen_181_part_00